MNNNNNTQGVQWKNIVAVPHAAALVTKRAKIEAVTLEISHAEHRDVICYRFFFLRDFSSKCHVDTLHSFSLFALSLLTSLASLRECNDDAFESISSFERHCEFSITSFCRMYVIV